MSSAPQVPSTSAAPASPAAQSQPVHLRRTPENDDEIEALAGRFGGRVGIDGVLADLDRQAVRTAVPGLAVSWGLRWDEEDAATRRWWPQGISTSADANDDEDVAGRRVLVASWYSKDGEGSRVTFLDLADLRYRHVLLVEPVRHLGTVRMRPLDVHAGGIVWCGHQLYVAGTTRGLFSFLVDDLLRVPASEESRGYEYVLPVRVTHEAVSSQGTEPLRYSFLSLDRSASPPELVAGEYGRGEQTRRLVRYPLDPATLRLAAGEDGTSRPTALDAADIGHMQGATVVRGVWYVTHSRGRWRLGVLHTGAPGRFRVFRHALPVGPEDISFWPSTDTLWTLTEYPGHRYVVAVDRSRLGDPG